MARRSHSQLSVPLVLLSLASAACSDADSPQGLTAVAEGQPSDRASPAAEYASAPATAATAPSLDADAGTDAKAPMPFDMRTWQPHGKGLWIWHFDYVGMTPQAAATRAKALGVAYVLIKSGQDAKFWTTRFNAAIVSEFTSRGIRVLAWPYVTPTNVSASIDAAAEAARVPGCDGLVLDVEVEWETGGKTANSAKAAQLCQGIRSKVPGVWLGYTSFGWIGYHSAFPFAAFDEHCGDAAFPQVYFSDRGVAWNGPHGLSEALAQYKAAGLKAPLWPITSNDDVAGTNQGPSTVALNGFLAAAGPYTSLWTLPDKARPEKLQQLDALSWANP